RHAAGAALVGEQFPPFLGIPELHLAAQGAGGDAPAVGAERHAGGSVPLCQHEEGLAPQGIPHPHLRVPARPGNALAAGASGPPAPRNPGTSWRVPAPQPGAAPSRPPGARCLPPGLKPTLLTWPVCRRSESFFVPAWTSQIPAMPFLPLAARRLPSGLKATQL